MSTKVEDKNLAVGQRAPGAVHAAARAADRATDDASQVKQKPKPDGAPEGYKPAAYPKYVSHKDGDHILAEDGTKTAVTPENTNVNAGKEAMETLPPGHTYRDRVEAQAKALGVPVVEGETMEYLMWKIRMMASS